jgi:hypothetical protein
VLAQVEVTVIAHAILFVVLPLVVAWFAGVTACLPPHPSMLTRNRRSRVVSDTANPEIKDQPMTAEQWLAKYAPANEAVSAARSGNAEREAAD